jgi:hypothetical protein
VNRTMLWKRANPLTRYRLAWANEQRRTQWQHAQWATVTPVGPCRVVTDLRVVKGADSGK